MLKKISALAVLTSSSLIASATDYPQCFIKYKNYAEARDGATGTDFEYYNRDLDPDFTPLQYNVCSDVQNEVALISF